MSIMDKICRPEGIYMILPSLRVIFVMGLPDNCTTAIRCVWRRVRNMARKISRGSREDGDIGSDIELRLVRPQTNSEDRTDRRQPEFTLPSKIT